MNHFKLIILMGMLAAMSACHQSFDNEVHIVRLGQALQTFESLSQPQQQAMVDSLRPELDACFAVMGMSPASVSETRWLSQSEAIKVFQPDVDSVFPNLKPLEKSLTHIIKKADEYGLQLPPLRFATIAWGYTQSIVRADSVVLIALNHYLGSDYPGYSHWEAYMRQQKTPEKLPYNIAEALVRTQWPMETPGQETLLSRMLYEGAVVESVMKIVPDASLAKCLGYTPKQLEYLEDNVQAMWQEMAIRKMIYDIDPVTIDRLILPAPASPLLSGQAPGSVGRYIGYKIVKKYLSSHPSMSLADLLSPAFYGSAQSLIESGF